MSLIKNDLPPPNPSILDGYREIIASLRQQKIDPEYAYRKELPPTARPYRDEFHNLQHRPRRRIGKLSHDPDQTHDCRPARPQGQGPTDHAAGDDSG